MDLTYAQRSLSVCSIVSHSERFDLAPHSRQRVARRQAATRLLISFWLWLIRVGPISTERRLYADTGNFSTRLRLVASSASASTPAVAASPLTRCRLFRSRCRTEPVHHGNGRISDAWPSRIPTATGVDEIPAWFLRLRAPVFATPLSSSLINRLPKAWSHTNGIMV